MTPSHGITKGLNRKENWDECLGKLRFLTKFARQGHLLFVEPAADGHVRATPPAQSAGCAESWAPSASRS